jgi:hypothetical protein
VRRIECHSDLLFRLPYKLARQRLNFTRNAKLKVVRHTMAALKFDLGPVVRNSPHDAIDGGLAEVENDLTGQKCPATGFDVNPSHGSFPR